MNTQSFKQNIEIIANVGVLLGIILLAYEVNQNNQLLEDQADEIYYQNITRGQEWLALNNDLAVIYVKANRNEELDDVERVRIGRYYRRQYRSMWWDYGKYQDGKIERPSFERWNAIINDNRYSIEEWEWAIKNLDLGEFARFMEENVISQLE